MEVYFLDVGQGTSQLILLGDRSAIVIDAGPKTEGVLAQALSRYSVDRIVRFVTTHSHADHVGGAESLVTTYASQIDELWFLDDPQLRASRFYRRLRQLVDDHEIRPNQLRRIERDDRPRVLYRDDERQLKLLILSPDFAANMGAIDAGDANKTAAILMLLVGNYCIVFGSDSMMEQWRRLHAERGCPLECNVLAVPHHGGNMGQLSDADFQWLYANAIKAKYAVISVGTRNTFGHPKSVVMDALRQSGATVLCTQITGQCCTDLEQVRAGVLQPLEQVRNSVTYSKTNSSGRSQRVACAGTVVAEIEPEGLSIRSLTSHQRGVDDLAGCAYGTPLCRRA